MPSFRPLSRQVLCAILVLVSILALWPFLNFQDFLSPGDHGRDLYAGQAVLRGEAPYKDFWWVYGPLIPYVWGIFYIVLGAHITTLIIAKLFFTILAALFIFLTLLELTSPVMALIGGLWFVIFHPDFFFTYHHIAGIAMLSAAIWGMSLYIKEGRSASAFYALIPIFLLCLTKINFGLVALVMLALTVLMRDIAHKTPFDSIKKVFYVLCLLVIPAVVYLIYACMLGSLSIMEIRQCLPYLDGDQPYSSSPWVAIASFIKITIASIRTSWMNIAFAAILWISIARNLFLWIKRRLSLLQVFAVAFFIAFFVFNIHEFLKSGVWYRAFWAEPLSLLLCFVLIDLATAKLKSVRKAVFGFLIFMAAASWFTLIGQTNATKIPSQAFTADGNTVYIRNEPAWISTVEQTSSYLKATLKKDELFFALPYDCIYYFLTGKKSPTRQLIFFDHIKIPPDQELSVIAELEKNNVNYVLVSNRAFSRMEPGLGIFGKTYCPRLAAYINANFKTIAQFGSWQNEPGWAWNHGTMILKRTSHAD